MYEVSSDNTNTVPRNESSQKVASKSISSTTKNEKLASQTLLAQTTSLNSSAPVCKYNFDVTQEDYDLWNNEHPEYFPRDVFPFINGQKFGFKVEPRSESEYGDLNYVALSKVGLNLANDIGDFTLPHTGIIAFEMELKLPTSALGNSSLGNSTYYSSGIGFSGVTNNGYTIRSNYHFDIGAHDFEFGENPPRLYHSVSSEMGDYEFFDNYFKNKQMTDNTNEYQRLGVYINQDTNQVGFISNDVDEGYQFKLPGALQKIAFSMNGNINILSTDLFGQELSNELITNRNALQFNYPQGTTDMCGNAI
ncbi:MULTISPECIES: DUF4882 family protein [Acinetobacter]|jgi:hypothetical protein|uniref:DUF4882 domain-containing protein n=1 Tax=Acinetobacter pittii TaxID=48296 RepID=A0A242U963_ACIPI|nr:MULTISPECIES: DUF4882 family protein [Acinetobacter]EXS20759.1 hypothetical protein J658_3994 [Acinetobacter baumannii 573719]MBJ8470725.1 DUF4882 family protein [Acinetobacter pittii]MBJ8500585.1 DUF4882 family protein [Acinetobacter pittii]MBJ9892932.1 DUF4882 family protein [Acinetobacter pittii]MCU4478498.1 DUF4882 domain-containing protein [Acinetobacter sp. WU_MDCI_Abxd143]